MPGQPEHAAAETPVTGAARNDHRIELMRPHLVAQRTVTALVFGPRELLPDRIAVVGRVAHVGERQGLIKLRSDDIPRLWTDTRRTDVHSGFSLLRFAEPDLAARQSSVWILAFLASSTIAARSSWKNLVNSSTLIGFGSTPSLASRS